jgi:hypothetical protein
MITIAAASARKGTQPATDERTRSMVELDQSDDRLESSHHHSCGQGPHRRQYQGVMITVAPEGNVGR